MPFLNFFCDKFASVISDHWLLVSRFSVPTWTSFPFFQMTISAPLPSLRENLLRPVLPPQPSSPAPGHREGGSRLRLLLRETSQVSTPTTKSIHSVTQGDNLWRWFSAVFWVAKWLELRNVILLPSSRFLACFRHPVPRTRRMCTSQFLFWLPRPHSVETREFHMIFTWQICLTGSVPSHPQWFSKQAVDEQRLGQGRAGRLAARVSPEPAVEGAAVAEEEDRGGVEGGRGTAARSRALSVWGWKQGKNLNFGDCFVCFRPLPAIRAKLGLRIIHLDAKFTRKNESNYSNFHCSLDDRFSHLLHVRIFCNQS